MNRLRLPRPEFAVSSAVLLAITPWESLAASPEVIRTVPENVDPTLKQLEVEFDQDMDSTSYS